MSKPRIPALADWSAQSLFIFFLAIATLLSLLLAGSFAYRATGTAIRSVQEEISESEIRLLSNYVENTLEVQKVNLESLGNNSDFQALLSSLNTSYRDYAKLLRPFTLNSTREGLIIVDSKRRTRYARHLPQQLMVERSQLSGGELLDSRLIVFAQDLLLRENRPPRR